LHLEVLENRRVLELLALLVRQLELRPVHLLLVYRQDLLDFVVASELALPFHIALLNDQCAVAAAKFCLLHREF
jgi:hypothetical protein